MKNKDEGLTSHSTKMVADKLLENSKYPIYPKKSRPNLSVLAQKFGIFQKKNSLGVHSPWTKLWAIILIFVLCF